MIKSAILSQDQEETLSGFLDIGYKEIESRLNKLLQQDVSFEDSSWALCVKNKVDHFLKSVPPVAVIVEQSFVGQYDGKGFLIFEKKDAHKISGLVLNEEASSSGNFSSDQKDALKEIGNITINGLVCSADNFLGDEHEFHVPTCFTGYSKNILNIYELNDDSFPILVMHTHFKIGDESLKVIVGLVIDSRGIQTLASKLEGNS